MIPCPYEKYLKVNVGKMYLNVHNLLKTPKGSRLAEDRSKVGKRYRKVQGYQKEPKGPRLAKGT